MPAYDVLRAFELMNQGKMNGYFCQGFNPLLSFPNRAKMTSALPSSSSWSSWTRWRPRRRGSGRTTASTTTSIRSRSRPRCSSCRPPASPRTRARCPTPAAGCSGTGRRSDPPGEARTDIEIMADALRAHRSALSKEGGAFPDPILNLNWPYALSGSADVRTSSPRRSTATRVENITDPKRSDQGRCCRPGKQLDSFAQLRDDGKTACGCWIYSGCYTERGNMMARRDSSDPGGRGIAPNWACSWPANRRMLYNRASCDPQGKPWSEKRKLIEWNGKQWVGFDVPDFGPTVAAARASGPFIMNPEGVARLFVRGLMRDGPFPAHYEPFELPLDNLRCARSPAAIRRRACSRTTCGRFGNADKFPYAATSYRLTEHFHFWTKHARVNAILQPEFFVEISEQLAKEKGIAGRRLGAGLGQARRAEGQGGRDQAHQAADLRRQDRACGRHSASTWLHRAARKKGWSPNSLTPVVGDANIETPEFKAFLVNIEPTTPPAVA